MHFLGQILGYHHAGGLLSSSFFLLGSYSYFGSKQWRQLWKKPLQLYQMVRMRFAIISEWCNSVQNINCNIGPLPAQLFTAPFKCYLLWSNTSYRCYWTFFAINCMRQKGCSFQHIDHSAHGTLLISEPKYNILSCSESEICLDRAQSCTIEVCEYLMKAKQGLHWYDLWIRCLFAKGFFTRLVSPR